MDLLPLFDESVVLRDTSESQLFHQIDLIWCLHVLVLERLDNHRKRSAEEHDLSLFRMESQQLFDNGGKLRRE